MHQKISYEIFSERGKYHEEQGKENEDAINVVTNGDYMFVILSDGAGSSKFAKEAAQTTVEAATKFCFINSEKIFLSNELAMAELISFVQESLISLAKNINTDISEMKSTLLVLGLNIKCKKYVTMHIGDGIIAKIKDRDISILSYPENGITTQYTYTVNSKYVMKHFRTDISDYSRDEIFLICSDGLYNNNNIFKLFEMNNLSLDSDDVSYCIIIPEIV